MFTEDIVVQGAGMRGRKTQFDGKDNHVQLEDSMGSSVV